MQAPLTPLSVNTRRKVTMIMKHVQVIQKYTAGITNSIFAVLHNQVPLKKIRSTVYITWTRGYLQMIP